MSRMRRAASGEAAAPGVARTASAQASIAARAPGASRSSARRSRTVRRTASAVGGGLPAVAEEAGMAGESTVAGEARGAGEPTVTGAAAAAVAEAAAAVAEAAAAVGGGGGGGGGGGRGGGGGPPAGEAGLGFGEDGVGPFPVGAVVVREQREADRHRVHAGLPQLADEDQVAQRLGHLRALVGDHAGVRVHPREDMAIRRAGHPDVRGAHLVVREDQVAPAGLHVESRPEVFDGDRGALHVPARPAAAEARVPGGFARPLRPPDERIERVLLPWPLRVAAALGDRAPSSAPPSAPTRFPGRTGHRTPRRRSGRSRRRPRDRKARRGPRAARRTGR